MENQKTKDGRGGVRDGAGKPKLPPGEKKISTSITLSPQVMARLRQEKKPSQFIERLLCEKFDL